MTLRQRLVHLWRWLRLCPLFDPDPCCYVGPVNGDCTCLVCGRAWPYEDDENEDGEA